MARRVTCGVEAGGRDHHRRAVAGAAEVGHHHPEAVVEGHRDAQPVLLGEADQLGHQVAVVEDVAVGQGRTLGPAGGARGVLDVDRVAGIERPHPGVERVGVQPLTSGDQGVPVVGVEVDHALQQRAADRAGRGRLLDHRPVVAGLEGTGRDQQAHARLGDGVGELVGLVGRVDVDQDRADLRGGELRDRPPGAVGAPDADPVPLLDAGRQQTPGDELDVAVELAPGPACAGGELDHRLAVGEPGDGAVEVGPDRLLEQRGLRLASGVGLHGRNLARAEPARQGAWPTVRGRSPMRRA